MMNQGRFYFYIAYQVITGIYSFLSSGLAVRKEIPHTSTLSTPNFKYPNLATSNVTMFEGDIDEIDMDDISIHFEEKQDTENEKKNRLVFRIFLGIL